MEFKVWLFKSRMWSFSTDVNILSILQDAEFKVWFPVARFDTLKTHRYSPTSCPLFDTHETRLPVLTWAADAACRMVHDLLENNRVSKNRCYVPKNSTKPRFLERGGRSRIRVYCQNFMLQQFPLMNLHSLLLHFDRHPNASVLIQL